MVAGRASTGPIRVRMRMGIRIRGVRSKRCDECANHNRDAMEPITTRRGLKEWIERGESDRRLGYMIRAGMGSSHPERVCHGRSMQRETRRIGSGLNRWVRPGWRWSLRSRCPGIVSRSVALSYPLARATTTVSYNTALVGPGGFVQEPSHRVHRSPRQYEEEAPHRPVNWFQCG